MPMYRREYQLSSRVDTMKWMGILQMVLGLIMFIICLVMVGIDLEHYTDRIDEPGRHNRPDNDYRVLIPQPLSSMQAVFLAMTMIVIAVGAGTAGSVMSRYEGLAYNIPARHILLVLSVMNGMVSMGFMVFHGQVMFEFIDAGLLNTDSAWEKSVLAMMLVLFVLAFFNMVIAFITAIVATFWNPSMDQQAPAERYPEKPPVIVEDRPYYTRHAYSDSPYYSGGYGRSRTLPAIKYY